MKIKRGRLQQIIREELTRVLSEQADNDLDTDNDGKISAGELEAELEDIKDDLDTVDIVDVETGEVLYVGAGTQRGIPAAKVDDFIRDLKLSAIVDDKDGTERSIELSKADFEKLEAHIDDVYDRPKEKRPLLPVKPIKNASIPEGSKTNSDEEQRSLVKNTWRTTRMETLMT